MEFVALDERSSAFPSSGWLTRRNLESLIPSYGPKALAEQQSVKQEQVKRAQEAGKRSAIAFAPARKRDRDRDRDRDREDKEGEKRFQDSLERRDKVGRALAGMKGREGWSEGSERDRDKDRGKRRAGGEGSRWDRR